MACGKVVWWVSRLPICQVRFAMIPTVTVFGHREPKLQMTSFLWCPTHSQRLGNFKSTEETLYRLCCLCELSASCRTTSSLQTLHRLTNNTAGNGSLTTQGSFVLVCLELGTINDSSSQSAFPISRRGHRESLSIITLKHFIEAHQIQKGEQSTDYKKINPVFEVEFRKIYLQESSKRRSPPPRSLAGLLLACRRQPRRRLTSDDKSLNNSAFTPSDLSTPELARAVRQNFGKDFMYLNKRIFLNAKRA